MIEVIEYNYIIISTYNGEYTSYKGDTDELMEKYELFCPLSDNALCLGVLENSYFDNLKPNKFCSWWYGGEMRGECLLLWEGEATHETVKEELDALISHWKDVDKKKAEDVRDDLIAGLKFWRDGGTETQEGFFTRIMEEKQAKEKQEETERMRQFKRIEENERTERDKRILREVLELCEIIKGKFKTEGKKAEFSKSIMDLLNSVNN